MLIAGLGDGIWVVVSLWDLKVFCALDVHVQDLASRAGVAEPGFWSLEAQDRTDPEMCAESSCA